MGPDNPCDQIRQSLKTMSKHLQEIFDFVKTASVDDLKQILDAVQNELPKREGKVDNFVVHVEDFCENEKLIKRVWEECESLPLTEERNKAPSSWLCSQDTPYIFTDKNPVHAAKDITEFPAISEMLSLVNSSSEVTGPLDSCLVIKYNTKTSRTSIHKDNEPLIDQNKSICSYSLGCERTLEFFEGIGAKPKCVRQFRVKNNSLVVMRPGTQQNLKHAVRAEIGTSKDSVSAKDVRYCLSFRAIVKSAPKQEEKTIPVAQHEPVKRVVLVAGDSYAARLDPKLLGKNKVNVDNVAEGGAKMDKVLKQLEKYAAKNPNVRVDKVILSIGTNDIRKVKDLNILRGPLKQLSSKIVELFPNSKVYMQSLLPLPLEHDKDWITNSRIIEFNRILFNECVFRRFYFIDVFHSFTKFRRTRNEPIKRFDPLFEVRGIHPNKEKGLGVLARFYIRAIHSKFFDPYVYQ